MLPKWVYYILQSLIAPVIVLAYHILVVGSVPVVTYVSFILSPIALMGLYLWFYGSDSPYINVPRKDMDPRKATSMTGPQMQVAMIVISIGIGCLAKFIIGIALIIASIVIIILSTVWIVKKGDSYELPTFGTGAKVAAIVAVAVLVTVPSAVLADTVFGESVNVTFDDTGVTVTAPMFDHHFSYDEIEDCHLEQNFDRGHRVYGYATGTICSGKWNNGMFGDYELASYTAVHSCIVLSVGGHIYAFNLSDTAQTQSAYETIMGHIQ